MDPDFVFDYFPCASTKLMELTLPYIFIPGSCTIIVYVRWQSSTPFNNLKLLEKHFGGFRYIYVYVFVYALSQVFQKFLETNMIRGNTCSYIFKS